ncbi:hypothetical protein BKA69DRAFT_1104918 [Paraphysoderma sedebokerense]|nr:hypothetical protein BKA69DRAFT_1104918 [Paraphysoderma sedebokerense]
MAEERSTLIGEHLAPSFSFAHDKKSARGSTTSLLPAAPTRLHIHTSPRRSSVTTSQNKEPARLVYTTSHGGKMSFSLVQDTTTIGRKEDNHIALSCAKISKHHAVIERNSDGKFILRDRNSSNGVKVNEKYIHQFQQLNDRDVIQIGSVVLTFYDDKNDVSTRRPSDVDSNLKLVTILPSERKYEETVSIRAELDGDPEPDFVSVKEINDVDVLKQDYEKLRLAYELSKVSLTSDITDHLTKMLDLMFSVLPVDRGVVLLVDKNTSLLTTNMVKLREGKGYEGREILLSSTILQRVYNTRKCLITSDACEDPDLGKSKSIAKGQIRSVICVPIIAHDQVLGILHLDSRDRINTFLEKDLSLVQAIINQTAIAIENTILFGELQTEIRVTEQLGRFLPPQVVEKMVHKEGAIKKGGKECVGTVVFADIRDFTSLSEKSSPSEVFDLLNDFFERLVKIVFKHSGIVDKFIGDCIMAVFGTLDSPSSSSSNSDSPQLPMTPADYAYYAVRCGLEFKSAINELNADRIKQGKLPIEVGVGVNTGSVMSGFLGSSQRLEYTSIGDTVNCASRICGFAGGDQVLVSEDTWNMVKHRIDGHFVARKMFKGKEVETAVYEVDSVKRLNPVEEEDDAQVDSYDVRRDDSQAATKTPIGSPSESNPYPSPSLTHSRSFSPPPHRRHSTNDDDDAATVLGSVVGFPAKKSSSLSKSLNGSGNYEIRVNSSLSSSSYRKDRDYDRDFDRREREKERVRDYDRDYDRHDREKDRGRDYERDYDRRDRDNDREGERVVSRERERERDRDWESNRDRSSDRDRTSDREWRERSREDRDRNDIGRGGYTRAVSSSSRERERVLSRSDTEPYL